MEKNRKKLPSVLIGEGDLVINQTRRKQKIFCMLMQAIDSPKEDKLNGILKAICSTYFY